MPSPGSRLILFAALLLPATLLAVTGPSGQLVAVLGYLSLVSVALLDLLLSGQQTAGLHWQSTGIVRMAKGTKARATLRLKLENPAQPPPWLEAGLPLPLPLEPEQESQRLQLATTTGMNAQYDISWAFHAPERGHFHVSKVYYRVPSPLGLWVLRRQQDIDLEIGVFPNLKDEKRFLANLFLNRGLTGLKRQRQLGQGREYDQLRDYQPGDSILDIHWKASAKRQSLVTKTYQVERTQEVYLVLDHSRLSGRRLAAGREDSPPEAVLERFLTAATLLSLATEREGDLFGVLTFARQVDGFLPASSGPAHQRALQQLLYQVQVEDTFPDFEALLTFIRLRLRRRALLIFLTDLSDPSAFELFEQQASLIRGVHYPLVNMLQPAGCEPLFERHSKAAEPYQQLAGHLVWQELQQRRRRLNAQGLPTLLLPGERLAVELVNQYFQVKQRQAV